ncbi:hypothetical protein GCM10027267_23260 [Paramicrobacterium agarici]
MHYHFDSLHDVLRRAAIREMELARDHATAEFSEHPENASPVGAMLAELAEYDGTDPSSRVVIEAYLASTRDAVLRQQMQQLMTGFRSAVSASFARSGHRDPDAAAVVVLAVLDGLILHKGLDPEIPIDDAVALVEAAVMTAEKGREE